MGYSIDELEQLVVNAPEGVLDSRLLTVFQGIGRFLAAVVRSSGRVSGMEVTDVMKMMERSAHMIKELHESAEQTRHDAANTLASILEVMYAMASSSAQPVLTAAGSYPHRIADFLARRDLFVQLGLTESGVFTMYQARRFFGVFGDESFFFEDKVRSLTIETARECLPNYSFAAGFLYPETLDSMWVRSELVEPIGVICFECGGCVSQPRISVMQIGDLLRLPVAGDVQRSRAAETCGIHGLANGIDGYCSGCEADPNIRILTCKRCRRSFAQNRGTSSAGLCAWCVPRLLDTMRVSVQAQ